MGQSTYYQFSLCYLYHFYSMSPFHQFSLCYLYHFYEITFKSIYVIFTIYYHFLWNVSLFSNSLYVLNTISLLMVYNICTSLYHFLWNVPILFTLSIQFFIIHQTPFKQCCHSLYNTYSIHLRYLYNILYNVYYTYCFCCPISVPQIVHSMPIQWLI